MPKPEFVLVPREPTEEMLEAALDKLGQRVVPYTAERESGVPVECDIDEETANYCNLAAKEGFGTTYRAMLSAAPPSPSVDEEMLEALKPLAALAEVFDSPGGTTPTKGEIYTWSRMINGEPKDFTLTVEMLRAARAAIARDTGAKP